MVEATLGTILDEPECEETQFAKKNKKRQVLDLAKLYVNFKFSQKVIGVGVHEGGHASGALATGTKLQSAYVTLKGNAGVFMDYPDSNLELGLITAAGPLATISLGSILMYNGVKKRNKHMITAGVGVLYGEFRHALDQVLIKILYPDFAEKYGDYFDYTRLSNLTGVESVPELSAGLVILSGTLAAYLGNKTYNKMNASH